MDCSRQTNGAAHGPGLYFSFDYSIAGQYNKGEPGTCVAALILMDDIDKNTGRTGKLSTQFGGQGIVVHDTRYVLPLGLLVPEGQRPGECPVS